MFGLFRVIGGIGVGVASVIAPAYIAETSPPRIRGRLGSLQQLAIVTGIFVSLAVDCAAGAPRRRAARGVVAGFAGLAVDVHHHGGARHPLRRAGLHDSRVAALSRCDVPHSGGAQGADHAARGEEPGADHQPDPGIAEVREAAVVADLRKPTGGLYGIVWVGVGLSVFQQFVGINVIFYYSNVLWQAVGSARASRSSSP